MSSFFIPFLIFIVYVFFPRSEKNHEILAWIRSVFVFFLSLLLVLTRMRPKNIEHKNIKGLNLCGKRVGRNCLPFSDLFNFYFLCFFVSLKQKTRKRPKTIEYKNIKGLNLFEKQRLTSQRLPEQERLGGASARFV